MSEESVPGCSCGMADRGAPGHDHEPRFYWEAWHEGDLDDPRPFGRGTARIIDLEAGGVIAYCHTSTAHVIVLALRKSVTKDDYKLT